VCKRNRRNLFEVGNKIDLFPGLPRFGGYPGTEPERKSNPNGVSPK